MVEVRDGEVLAVLITNQDMSSGFARQSFPTFGIIDAGIDYSDGWPPGSTEQGSYYQSHAAEFNEQAVINIPPGTYSLKSVHITLGQMGTCDAADL